MTTFGDHERRLIEAYAKLLSLASHELRTPASVVGGYLRMLQDDAESPLSPRHARMVGEAARSCARLVTLINELSEIGRLDTGTAGFASDTIDLFPFIQELAGTVHEGDDRGVRLVVTGSPAGASLGADRHRLGAAFSALFRAVLREQLNDTTVVAECRSVQDGGTRSAVVVIAREDAVQRAYEAPASAFDEQRGGIGLTLPIARRVIEHHGGRVWSPAPAVSDGRTLLKGAVIVSLPLRG